MTDDMFVAFEKFINQRPGVDPRNYFSTWRDADGRRAYNSEVRSITADRRRALDALTEARRYPFNAEAMSAALKSAFSGRLTWTEATVKPCTCTACPDCGEPRTVCPTCGFCTRCAPFPYHKTADCKGCEEGQPDRPAEFEYCTGQYWPTEYRKAAAAVLETYAHTVRPKTQPHGKIPRSMAELRSMADAAGSHWFDRSNMRFFRSRIMPTIYAGTGGVYFLSSEQPPDGARKFSVRAFDVETADITTVGNHCSMTGREAAALARRMADSNPPLCRTCAGDGRNKYNAAEQCWNCKGTGKKPQEQAA